MATEGNTATYRDDLWLADTWLAAPGPFTDERGFATRGRYGHSCLACSSLTCA
jgi:hypothetical protein